MIEHPRHYQERLQPTEVDFLHASALQVLERRGMCIQSDDILECMADAGFRTQREQQRIWFRADDVEKHVAAAPSHWTLHARSPRRSIVIGERRLNVVPGYGSPFVADSAGQRRPATLEDFRCFTTLADQCDIVDVMSCVLVEPTDVPLERRALDVMRCLLTQSDKPLMGLVYSREAIEDALSMARIVFGELNRPYLLALVNINSPLRLDFRMAEAMLAYLRAGQAILLTPGIMMGITSPVTVAGALVQAWAELLGVATIAQVIRPGAPLIIGTGGFGSDLRCAGGGFGRPENALGIVLGAQLARRMKLPYRCSAVVTGSRLPDCRSGYERMMTGLSAWQSGAHLALQGMGTLDNISTMSREQFVIDAEIWGYIRRLSTPIAMNEEALALDVIQRVEGHYLMEDHTVRHMREEIYQPKLAPPQSYDVWLKAGGRDVVHCAAERLEKAAVQPPPSALPDDICKELDAYITSRLCSRA